MQLQDQVEAFLAQHNPKREPVCLGLSGGLDSVVLLALLRAAQQRFGFTLRCVHVNHGISEHAASWEAFCRQLCQAHGVPLSVERVRLDSSRGIGLEAAARRARYDAYARDAATNHWRLLALAHHLDDQVETFFYRLLRGAGVTGLAAMRARAEWQQANTGLSITLLRPLLVTSRQILAEFAGTQGLRWVEDDSNRNTALDRNFLRHQILPHVETRFPAYRGSVQRAMQHLGEAVELIDALAVVDRAACSREGQLLVPALRALPAARAKNVLRHFLREQVSQAPDARRLAEIYRQLMTAGDDAAVQINVGAMALGIYRGALQLQSLQPPAAALLHLWQGELEVHLASAFGAVHFSPTVGAGVAREKLARARVTLRSRQGGEHLRLAANRPRRTLKNLLQEHGVPPWQRARMPLLFADEQLVWVPGIGIDCAFQAQAGESGLIPRWIA